MNNRNLHRKRSAHLLTRKLKKTYAFIAIVSILCILFPNIISALEGCDEALSKGDAETLNPDSDAVKKAIDDYAWVSGIEAGWAAVGHEMDTKTWIDDTGETVEWVRNPLQKGAEKGMGSIANWHTNVELGRLYTSYKQTMVRQEDPNAPEPTYDYVNTLKTDIGAITSFARSVGSKHSANGSIEKKFFEAWIRERYRKEKEATEILKKAKELEIPINLSGRRGKATIQDYIPEWMSTPTPSYDRKISANPYTSFNRSGQMDWNFDILWNSFRTYMKLEKTLEGRLDEIFEQNDLPKNVLEHMCYIPARDKVKKDFMKKAYALMCQGKDAEITEYLNKDISGDICESLTKCLPLDFNKKKLDCSKKEPPQTKTEPKTDMKPAIEGQPGKNLSSLSDKAGLLHDLCRCSCNPIAGGGSKYDPAKGCVCLLNLGEGFTVPMASSGECFDKAAAAAGLDPKKLAEEINKDNYRHYKDLIDEARKIIEEYLGKAGLNSKTSSLESPEEDPSRVLLAANFSEDLPMGEILYAAAAKGSSASYVEMVKEKNRRGDPDRALALVRAAEAMMPDRKGELINILAEFAIIMSKASLNIVTDLEFDDGLYLLRKAAEFHKGSAESMVSFDIKRLTSAFEQWKKDWEVLQREIPNCLALIENKQVCECERLNSDKIMPASNSYTVYGHASSQKWEISAASGQPRAIPKKEKLTADLKLKLPAAIQKCASHPAMKTNEMSQLSGFEQYKFLEKSPYMNKEDFRKSSSLPISDEQAVKNAEKLLGEPGLCDCEWDKIKGILETAKKDIKYSKLEVDLTANKKSLKLGEYVRVHLSIRSGRKPYSYTITGDMVTSERMTQSPGLITEYPPKTAGKKIVKAVVTDAAGDSRTVTVNFDVLPPKGVLSSTGSGGRTDPSPVYDPTRDINYKDKPVDITSVNITEAEKAGTDFQDSQKWSQSKDTQENQQPAVPQSEAYRGAAKKETEGTKEKEKQTKPSYPPYNPNDDKGPKTGTDWTSWAAKGKGAYKETVQTSNASGSTSKDTGTSSGSSTDGSGSTSSTPKTTPSTALLTAIYENKSDANAHIFVEGESFSPKNRLAPGEKRTVSLAMPPDGRIKFIAGRNGQVISTKYWDGDPGDLNRYPMVRFVKGMGGKEELSITTNLK